MSVNKLPQHFMCINIYCTYVAHGAGTWFSNNDVNYTLIINEKFTAKLELKRWSESYPMPKDHRTHKQPHQTELTHVRDPRKSPSSRFVL